MMTFTDANGGGTIILPNNSIIEAYEGESICMLIDTSGIQYDVSDTWSYVSGQLGGGGGPTGP